MRFIQIMYIIIVIIIIKVYINMFNVHEIKTIIADHWKLQRL